MPFPKILTSPGEVIKSGINRITGGGSRPKTPAQPVKLADGLTDAPTLPEPAGQDPADAALPPTEQWHPIPPPLYPGAERSRIPGAPDLTPGPMRLGQPTSPAWTHSVCRLHVTTSGGKRVMATGFLTPSGLVATSGHVINHPIFGWAKEIVVTPGYILAGAAPAITEQTSQVFWACPDWDPNDIESGAVNDYGAIALPNPEKFKVCGSIRWKPLFECQEPFDREHPAATSGFPGSGNGEQRVFEGTFIETDIFDNTMLHSLQTEAGQSGSPLCLMNGDKAVQVIAIHSKASEDAPGMNVARLVTQGMLDQFDAWAKQAGNSSIPVS